MKDGIFFSKLLARGILLLSLMPNLGYAQVQEEWVATYNGRAYGNDYSVDVGVDSEGNVIVTGFGDQNPNPHIYDSDYTTIKYNTAGHVLWSARYSYGNRINDDACQLAIDGDNNVYIAGKCFVASIHWIIVKYNPDGAELWVADYDNNTTALGGLQDMVVDGDGNVYLTGYNYRASGGMDYDCFTVKFNNEGQQQWVSDYNSPTGAHDRGHAIDVDSEGNIYVTGYSYQYGDYNECFVINYNADGDTVWVATYPPTGVPVGAKGKDIRVGEDNNLYVAGHCGSSPDYHYLLLKYTPEGQFKWATILGNPPPNPSKVPVLEMDVECNLYMTAYTEIEVGVMDYITAKVDSQGVIQWVATYDGPNHLSDRSQDLALDADGNVYVTGSSERCLNDFAYATIKYDPNGNEQWVMRYFPPEYVNCSATGIALDEIGNAFVTGDVDDGHRRNYDYCTIKYCETPNSPDIEMSAARLNFGTVTIGEQADLPLTVYNVGNGTLVLYDIFCNLTVFSSDWDPADSLVLPGDSLELTVTFAPDDTIIFTDSLIVENNSGFCHVDLIGQGCRPSRIGGTSSNTMSKAFSLQDTYPNPFNPTTVLSFELRDASLISLSIYDISGREVSKLVNGWREAGSHEVTFDGSGLAAGVYVYRLVAGEFKASGKMVLLK